MLNPSIFKAYDIRGTYPDQLDEDGVYKIGYAFVKHLKVKQVAVAYDMRTMNPKLKPSLYQGIADAGASIVDLGLIGTEMMYFAVGHFNYESGIMLTASHNPPQYCGMKMVSKGAYPIGIETGLKEISEIALALESQTTHVEPSITTQEVFSAYREKINSLVDLSSLKKFKIVVDAGNGMGGYMLERILNNTNLEIIPMYFEPDGTFPNHIPDPMKEENVQALAARVKAENADLGIGLDGDADRCFFVDNTGEAFLGYFVVAIIAELMLKKYPNSKIVHEPKVYWAIQDKVRENGGTPLLEKTGHSFIKARMRQEDSVFGGETSSHFYYKDTAYADSSFLTIALMLENLQKKNLNLSDIMTEYKKKYFLSGEINYTVQNADTTIQKVEDFYTSQGLVADKLDGIAFDKDRDWHMSLRKSNTEPLVRLNIEAKSQDLVAKITSEVENIIKAN